MQQISFALGIIDKKTLFPQPMLVIYYRSPSVCVCVFCVEKRSGSWVLQLDSCLQSFLCPCVVFAGVNGPTLLVWACTPLGTNLDKQIGEGSLPGGR